MTSASIYFVLKIEEIALWDAYHVHPAAAAQVVLLPDVEVRVIVAQVAATK